MTTVPVGPLKSPRNYPSNQPAPPLATDWALRTITPDMNSSNTKQFHYSELNDTEIGLLQMVSDKNTQPIRLALRRYKLKEAPPFCALSYCWGDSKVTKECFCEYKGVGGRLAITSSLYTILGMIEVNKLTDGLPL
jgi:hypothetical protein